MSHMVRLLCALSAVGLLTACLPGSLDPDVRRDPGPSFALTFRVPLDFTPTETTDEIRVGRLQADLTARMGATVRPFDSRYSEIHRILWSPDGMVLAAQVWEPFPGGFDDHVFLYDRNLRRIYSASDNLLGHAMTGGCPPVPAPVWQPLVDDLIADGEIVPGSVAIMKPGTGDTQSASIVGWRSKRELLVMVTNDPVVVARAPDGREQDIAWALPDGRYGDFIPFGVVLSVGRRSAEVIGCKAPGTTVPDRARTHPEVTLGRGGKVFVGRRRLVDETGTALTGAELADGAF